MEYQAGDVIRVEGCSSTWDGEYTITEINGCRYTFEPPVDGFYTQFSAESNVDKKSKLISRVGCKYKVGDVIEVGGCCGSWNGLHKIEELHFPYSEDVAYYKTDKHITTNGFGENSTVGGYSKLHKPFGEGVEAIGPFEREKLLSLAKQLHSLESDVWEIMGDQSWDF